MKKIILALAAVSALGAATAASAQPIHPGFAAPGAGIDARQAEISHRIDMGLRNGSLNRTEAVRLRMQLREIQHTENDFRRSRPGLTPREVADLNGRLDRLSAHVFDQRHDRQYGAGYGRR